MTPVGPLGFGAPGLGGPLDFAYPAYPIVTPLAATSAEIRRRLHDRHGDGLHLRSDVSRLFRVRRPLQKKLKASEMPRLSDLSLPSVIGLLHDDTHPQQSVDGRQ